MDLEVVHDVDARTFRALSGGRAVGHLSYRIWPDGTWELYTTTVPSEFEGHGIGSELTGKAVAAAVRAGADVAPTCWFVAGWLERHPDALAAANPNGSVAAD